MPTYVAFLRAVNIGKRKYPMAELRTVLQQAGFDNVQTHIQTGNVLVESRMRSVARVTDALEGAMLADRGFEVLTVVLTPAELTQVAADADEVTGGVPPGHGHYVELLRTPLPPEAARLIEEQRVVGQRAVVRGRAVHLLLDIPYHEARAPDAAVRRAMGVSTNRNVKVIRALAEKWGR